MTAPGGTPVRFRRRSELLDFLLEVSAATSEAATDLDALLANIGEIVRKVLAGADVPAAHAYSQGELLLLVDRDAAPERSDAPTMRSTASREE